VLHHPAAKIAPPPHEAAPADFEGLVRLFESRRELLLGKALRDDVHLVSYAPGKVELRLTDRAPRDLLQRMMQCLEAWTGTRWLVSLSQAPGEMTLREQEVARAEAIRAEVLADPLVRAAMETFPGAELINILEADTADPGAGLDPAAPNSLRSAQR